MKIEIFDTTLRDGAQGAGMTFTVADRIKVIHALDDLGVSFIEIGNLDAGDGSIFDHIGEISLKNAELVAFGSTRRPNTSASDDRGLCLLADAPIKVCAIFGKCWKFQVDTVLSTTREENLAMISDSIRFLTSRGKEVIFDAEHFFDGYSDDPEFALEVVRTAIDAGASRIILCDTNGGMLPDVVGMTVAAVHSAFPEAKLGIHCHNDLGMAVAASTSAVLSGAMHVQGTVSGIGERCGNANLNTLIPLLQLKLGYSCVEVQNLKNLTKTARYVCDVVNRTFDEHEPFVGGYAFSHKAGMHIDGVRKAPKTFEHTVPEYVGNERNLLVSSLSGRAALTSKMCSIIPSLTKESPEVAAALEAVRSYEEKGFQFEGAEASLMLILLESLGLTSRHFKLTTFKVLIGEPYSMKSDSKCSALIKVQVGDRQEITAAEGDGPVNALDLALRRVLSGFYPALSDVKLTDYKVRVFESDNATASRVRVFIESTDGTHVWRTTGVSADIIDASWQALRDSIEYKLTLDEGKYMQAETLKNG